MNYLAHLYLSGPEAGVKVGNFIGDYVKGNHYTRYAPPIRKGIILHRKIDTFTDMHPVFRESSKVFKPMYSRYSGVVADIVYDHFLAANWDTYSNQSLKSFVSESHRILMMHYFSLPGVVKQFLPFLIKSRRMELYKHRESVEKTLVIMANHSSLPNHAHWAMEQLNAYYDELHDGFFLFFSDVRTMCNDYLSSETIAERRAM